MIRTYIIFFIMMIFSPTIETIKGQWEEHNLPFPKIIDYQMNIEIDYEQEKLFADCRIKVTNPSDKPIDNIPLLLYRLMNVTSISDMDENALSFKQQVQPFIDWQELQANCITIQLQKPILPNDSFEFNVKYNGYLQGFTETGMSYVKDKISTDFTIIRNDCYAYPEIGIPNDQVNLSNALPSYNYHLNITVPDSLYVANGGELIDIKSAKGKRTFVYKSIKPSWRVDIAVADYKTLSEDAFKVYHFEKDSVGAKSVIEAWKKTLNLFTAWWGPLDDFKGFSIIEIPDGYGAQGDVTCIVQDEAAFSSKKELYKLYHEVSHLWNVKSNDTYSPRWEEGLARFIQYLTQNKLDGIESMQEATSWSIKKICKTNSLQNKAFVDFGKENLTDYSYDVGFILFQVLYGVIGEKDFHQIFKGYYENFGKKGATTKEFLAYANQQTKFNLDNFYKDWFLTSSYFDLLQKGHTIDDLVAYYKNKS